MSGCFGLPSRTAYCASKHAVNGFFSALRFETEPYGVSVTVAMPGTFPGTNFRNSSLVPTETPVESKNISVTNLKDVTDSTMIAADKRLREFTAPNSVFFILKALYPVFPSLVDRLSKK